MILKSSGSNWGHYPYSQTSSNLLPPAIPTPLSWFDLYFMFNLASKTQTLSKCTSKNTSMTFQESEACHRSVLSSVPPAVPVCCRDASIIPSCSSQNHGHPASRGGLLSSSQSNDLRSNRGWGGSPMLRPLITPNPHPMLGTY